MAPFPDFKYSCTTIDQDLSHFFVTVAPWDTSVALVSVFGAVTSTSVHNLEGMCLMGRIYLFLYSSKYLHIPLTTL